MAASPLTVIKEIVESNSITQAQLIAGLSFAQWGDCLGNDWQLFYYSPSIEISKKIAYTLLAKYEKQYEILGNPKTAEEWYKRTYNDFLKTRKKSNFFKLYWSSPAGSQYDNPFWKMDYTANIGIEIVE